jgi:prolipoprotein diacylglyceryltransferase
MEPLALFTGFRYFLYLRSRQGDPINQTNRTSIFIAAIFGALFGSRLVGGFENPPAMVHAKNMLLYFYENSTVLGGFLGGLWAVELVKKFIGERQASGDLFVYPILLALIIGRIGCFSMGIYEETYGLPTTLPWGMDLGDGVHRHPVALYEIVFLILLWVTLKKLDPLLSKEQGARFKVFMIAYCAFRLLLDFIKPHYTFPVGLSTIQLVSLAGLIYYTPHIIRYARKTIHLL